MKQFVFIVSLLSLLFSLPAYGSDRFLIEFKGGKPVGGGETLNLIEMVNNRASGYSGQPITEITVYANSRNPGYGGNVQLFDDHRRQISRATLSNGYASLPVYDGSQRAAYLYFDHDVFLHRIEIITARPLRPLKQKEIRLPKQVIEIGNFTKRNYQSEVMKFSVARGGYSAINFRVHIGEQHAVIVNSILVLANGNKVGGRTVGARLSSGDNEFSLDVPEGATDIQVSFAHGQGSSVQVFLLP